MQGRSSIALRPSTDPPRGFTVAVLLIAIAITVILAIASIPFFQRTIEAYRLRAAAWQLAGDLRLARQKAVTLQKRQRVCFTGCTTTVPANGYVIEREEASWVSDSKGLPFAGGVSMDPNVTAITFETKGEVNGATVTLANSIGIYQVRTASTGRVLVCKESC
ncbi:MAG: GspH/FimT family pseudopilin [candidate division NC10 bacterium]|nr:GspH/FimT family pseudopilin [candidate division NC10 bacterium]